MEKVLSGSWSFALGLAVTLALVCICSAPAMAEVPGDVSQSEIRNYQQDTGVSAQKAEENLVIQSQGDEIVEDLELSQGERYAGVWFDNKAGEFVVPALPSTSSASIANALPDSLEDDFRTKPAQYSWSELLAGHQWIDKALLPLLEEGQIQTSLDPRTNAVVIAEADDTSSVERAQVQAAVEEANVRAEVRQRAGQLDVITQACTTADPRLCDKPLRGGAGMIPACAGCPGTVGECSAGFKAMGITTGYRYVLTAGHCAVGISKWASEDTHANWYLIGNVEGFQFPVHDWAKINATGSSWDTTPWPSKVAHFWEDQERSITAEGASYLGEYVCHSGNASGTTCGNVGELDRTITVNEGILYHETEFNDICSRGGDSGGPVFAGNTGVGIYSAVNHETSPGGPCDARGFYIELTEATEAMGVSVAQSPVARTAAASGIYSTQANLNGTVDPNGLPTTYHFEYGVSTAYGINTTSQSAGAGWGPVPVAATITSLRGLSGYHFRLVATNSTGTSYGPDMQFATPAPPPSVSELGFVRFNGTGNTYLNGYVGAPAYKGLAVTGETGYPKITDPQNIQSLALDIDGDGLDELGFIRFNGSGNTHLDSYVGAPGYKNLGSSCDTGYPKIADPQNVQAVALDPNGDGIDDLGFVRLNSPANAHLDAYSGSCYKTLSSYCDTGYPSISDPKNVQVIAIDTNGDGTDELGFVRLNSSNAHLDAYTGSCYKTLSSYCNTGYPKITDPQNVRVLAIDTNGDGIDELGFLRYNPASGKAHLDAYTGSCYTGLLGYSDSGYPAVSNPENVQALAINLTYDPAPGGWYEDSLAGSITEDPDVSSWGPNRLDVFGRASDGSYRHKWWGGSTWSGWETLGSPGTIVSGVGTVGMGGNRIDAVGRTSTNSVVDMWWNGSGWLTENFGGNITGDPDFSSANGANYDIWARGASGMLEHRYWTGAKWSPWESTGLAIASSPGAVSWGASRLDVVARASDNSVLHFWWNGSKWITENMGGNIQGAPDIASWASGRLDIFARGADNTLMHKYYNGTWSAWESLGGSLASSPGAVSWGPNRVDVVARASDNTVSHWYWNDP